MQLVQKNAMHGSQIILADLAGVENVMECSVDKIVQIDYIHHYESPKYSENKKGKGLNLPIAIDDSMLHELKSTKQYTGNQQQRNNNITYRSFSVQYQCYNLIEDITKVSNIYDISSNIRIDAINDPIPSIQFDSQTIPSIVHQNINILHDDDMSTYNNIRKIVY